MSASTILLGIVAFGSVLVSRHNRHAHKYLSRPLWATAFALDVGTLVLLPGWWKILGILITLPSVAGLYSPVGFHREMGQKLEKDMIKAHAEWKEWDK